MSDKSLAVPILNMLMLPCPGPRLFQVYGGSGRIQSCPITRGGATPLLYLYLNLQEDPKSTLAVDVTNDSDRPMEVRLMLDASLMNYAGTCSPLSLSVPGMSPCHLMLPVNGRLCGICCRSSVQSIHTLCSEGLRSLGAKRRARFVEWWLDEGQDGTCSACMKHV